MTKDEIVVLVTGNFNILHPGHLRLFRFARECGDRLIVSVNSDQKAGVAAHITESLRLEGVRCNQWVDDAFISDETDVEIIKVLKPDIMVKGKEHETAENPEENVLRSYGGRLLFGSGETVFSSMDLITKEFSPIENSLISWPRAFMNRHGITSESLGRLIQSFSSLKVCVIGDIIIDEYITCDALGMSREDPTIVVTPIDTKKFLGGASIVAAHGAGLGADVTFLSVAGHDNAYDFATGKLEEYKVKFVLLKDPGRPTTLKQRFRCANKTLLRVSHLHQSSISSELQEILLSEFKRIIDKIDLLIFSDFSYGCLPQSVVSSVSELCRARGVKMAADSQSSSQIGDISRFVGMDLITPTEREARIGVREHEEGLVVLAERLKQVSKAKNVLLKLGSEGVLIHAGRINPDELLTDRVDALNAMPRDVAGAGDSLLISSSLALAAGGDIWHAACVGSLAAAMQISRVGNTPLTLDEFIKELPR
jgi:rfaE bifunctional protein kinase chain/domain